jgi:hypothetical protein
MISIWDKPAELNIAPIPFEIMLKAGMAKDKMYQDTIDEIQPYQDAILNKKALPGDDTEYLKQASQKLKDLVNNNVGKVDLTDPLQASKFLTQAKEIGLDPKLKRNEANYSYVEEQKKKHEEYKGKANGTYDSQTFNFAKILNQYTTPGSGGGDKFNISNVGIGSIGVDRRETFEKAFNDMQKSSGYSFKQLGDYIYKTSQEGFTGKDIDQKAQYALQSILQSDAGKQTISDYYMYKELDPKTYQNITPEQYVLQQLAQVGYEKVGMSYDSNKDDIYNRGIDKQDENMPITPETFNSQYTIADGEQFDITKQYGDTQTDNEGNIIVTPLTGQKIPIDPKDTPDNKKRLQEYNNNLDKKNQAWANEQTQKLRAELNYYRTNYPELKDMKDTDLVPIINQARQKTAQSFKGFSVAGLNTESLAGKLTAGITNKDLHIISNQGSKQTNFSELTNLSGMDSKELKDYIYSEIKEGKTEFVPTSKTSKAGWNIQVPTKSGNLQTVFIGGSDPAQQIFSPYDAIRKVFDKATPGIYTEDQYKVNKGNLKKEDDDYGTEAKLELIKDDQGKIVDSYYSINRILSKEVTKKALKAKNLDYQSALEAGFKFDAAGRLLINPTIDLQDDVTLYYNSKYLEKNQSKTKPNKFD